MGVLGWGAGEGRKEKKKKKFWRAAARRLPPVGGRDFGKELDLGCVCVQNHSTQDSHVVPHHGTDWAALRLTAQIGRDAVLSESYGRGYQCSSRALFSLQLRATTPEYGQLRKCPP